MPIWKLNLLRQKHAEKLAIEAHASYLILNSNYKNAPTSKNYRILENAANRLYRRYHFAFGG